MNIVKPTNDGLGLHLVTSDMHLSNYISGGPDSTIHKVGFKLVWLGDEDKECTVYGCKVNWTNETI